MIGEGTHARDKTGLVRSTCTGVLGGCDLPYLTAHISSIDRLHKGARVLTDADEA